MILTMRRYLLVLLVLLQMIAPLVHAHSGSDFARFGLHLPNLEIYSVADNQSSPAFQSLDYLTSSDDAIVSICAGIENPQHDSNDLLPLLYFPPAPVVFCPALISCEINFSPHTTFTFKTLYYSLQSPRAPPV